MEQTKHHLQSIRLSLLVINFFAVLFHSSVVLLSSKYIIQNGYARDFLETIIVMPQNPKIVFLMANSLYLLLVLVICYRDYDNSLNPKKSLILVGTEIALYFFVSHYLSYQYNGLILLIFSDIIYHLKDSSKTNGIMILLVIILLMTTYEVTSTIFPIANTAEYMNIFNRSTKVVLYLAKNVLFFLNIILFILFMISNMRIQDEKIHLIQSELEMINEVNDQLRQYAKATEKIGEENERKRLSREIHDTLGHALTGIAAGVDACIAMIDINPQLTKNQLQVVSKVVRQGISDVRASLNKLRPGALESHGLKVAIENMIEEFTAVANIHITFNYDLTNIDIEKTKEDVFFRTCQECITNAMRHGMAKNVDIHFYTKDNAIILEIQDDGKGCEDITYGFGLKQMTERAHIIYGTVEFDGSNGFKTTMTVPIMKGEQYD